MPNVVKYSTGAAPSNVLQKGNFYIGNNTGDYGNTFYTGIVPPSSGYTLYQNKASNGPSIYTASNDAQLISLTNREFGTNNNFSTAADCLNWFATQNDKMVFNIDYPSIVTNGLTANLDVTTTLSYPNINSIMYDISTQVNNGTFYGTPAFTTFNGVRTIRFFNNGKYTYNGDGYTLAANPGISAAGTSFTFEAWFYQLTTLSQTAMISNTGGCGGYRWGPQGTAVYWLIGNNSCSQYSEGTVANATTMIGRWVQMVGIFDRANTLGGGVKFYHYINGSLEGSAGTTNPTIDNLGAPGMCCCCSAFDGYLSIARVYNRALLQSEITQNWNAQRATFGL